MQMKERKKTRDKEERKEEEEVAINERGKNE